MRYAVYHCAGAGVFAGTAGETQLEKASANFAQHHDAIGDFGRGAIDTPSIVFRLAVSDHACKTESTLVFAAAATFLLHFCRSGRIGDGNL